MKPVFRTLVFVLSAYVLAGINARGWGQRFSQDAATAGYTTQEVKAADAGKPDEAASMPFTGTVAKQGKGYVLRDSSGEVFRLDDKARAAKFAGQSVIVTGHLDRRSKMLHVDMIEKAGV